MNRSTRGRAWWKCVTMSPLMSEPIVAENLGEADYCIVMLLLLMMMVMTMTMMMMMMMMTLTMTMTVLCFAQFCEPLFVLYIRRKFLDHSRPGLLTQQKRGKPGMPGIAWTWKLPAESTAQASAKLKGVGFKRVGQQRRHGTGGDFRGFSHMQRCLKRPCMVSYTPGWVEI